MNASTWMWAIWKEWSARTKLWCVLFAIFLCTDWLSGSWWNVFVGVILASALVKEEQTSGTLPFTLTKPVPRWLFGWVKWGAGASLILAAILVAGGLRWVVREVIDWPMPLQMMVHLFVGGSDPSWVVRAALGLMLGLAAGLYAWMVSRGRMTRTRRAQPGVPAYGFALAYAMPIAVMYWLGGNLPTWQWGILSHVDLWVKGGLTVVMLAAMPGEMERFEFSAQEG